MRKLILISAFVLASVSAHAADSRGLILASNDEPKAVEKVETTKPAETAPAAKTDTAPTDASAKPQATKTAKKSHVKGYEADEAKARRIAAKYGVYW
jgi:hypothetical protein